VTFYRCFAWREAPAEDGPDGPLFFPRAFQGDGRHDNPDSYGCIYVADRPVSALAEQLARFRGQRLIPALLRRRGLPLALAEIALADDAVLIDLDDPAVLRRERLRPSRVATRDRAVTQPQALRLHGAHRGAAGLLWWSTFEAAWMNCTLFDRAGPRLRVRDVRPLTTADPAVIEAADLFGMRITG
jgi:hypothetical protein